ncbi:ABC transporter permease [Paraburkholderia susongensis]|uniref:Xylose transport system permease protein XylH n=1 Tax=Paraburkholderia susongensis TaxID=1515439 RepID=A0A1X7L6J9_9BURK|nr:ABC transporter permease [Paraburkholderia susongensis]SMG49084.1 monosaccharide ABC transporter membrane protein, CUT2 family [Paraburkholderia susongensis]
MQGQNNSPAGATVVSSGATAPAATRRSSRLSTGQWLFQNVVWIWLVALIIIFGVLNPFFFTVSNFQNVILQSTVLGLLALAVSLPLMVAEIDLSIASNMGFSAAVGALLSTRMGVPAAVGVPVGILVSTAIGFFNGLCVTRLKMVSLIETLAMMIILQGALLATTQGNTISDMSDGYIWIGQYTIGNWPVMPVVFVIALIGMAFLLRRTVLGRKLYATGGNVLAANSAGIRVGRVKIIAFTISGLLSGIAGYLLAAWQMAITSDQGEGFLLYAIAAPIIGGVSVFGGRGGTAGILGGVLLLTVIHVGLAITSVPSFYVQMIGGILIFVAVAVDAVRVKFVSR